MPVNFACPKCRAVIRSPKPLAAGQRVKCPKCAQVFAVSGAAAGQTVAARAPGGGAGFNFEGPATAAAPAVRRPPKSAMAALNLSLLLLFLLVGSGAIAAAVYWHHTNPVVAVRATKAEGETATEKEPEKAPEATKPAEPEFPVNKGTGKEDPLAYLPADSNILAGIDVAAIAQVRPDLIEQLRNASMSDPDSFDPKKNLGIDFADFYSQVLVAAKGDVMQQAPPQTMTMVATSRTGFDPVKVAKGLKKAKPEKVNGKVVFSIEDKQMKTVFMPSDRIIVVTTLLATDEKLAALVGSDGSQPMLPAEALKLVREGQKGPAWVAVPFDEMITKLLEGLAEQQKGKVPPEFQPLLKAFTSSRGAAVLLNGDANNLRLTVTLACANAKDAQLLAGTAQAIWGAAKGQIEPQVMETVKQVKLPDVESLVKNLFATLTFEPRDTIAQVSVQFEAKPIETLAKEAATDPMGLQAKLGGAMQKAQQPPFKMSPQEQQLLELVNKARADEKLPALKPNPLLFKLARDHAMAMAKINANDDEIDGKDTPKRVEAAGYKYQMVTANIASGPGWQPVHAVQGWLGNAALKANIVEKYTETGIGIAVGADNAVFYYQIFATPE